VLYRIVGICRFYNESQLSVRTLQPYKKGSQITEMTIFLRCVFIHMPIFPYVLLQDMVIQAIVELTI
jgi:3-hydroxymyristoyl/3-hydroxydecanoyl-(acyl carrier protein) dehydratase